MIGQRLRQARDSLRLTLAQVSESTGFSDTAISDFENEVREPRIAQLAKLSTLYHRPIDYFLCDTPEPAPDKVLWRKRPEAGAEVVEAKFLELCRWYGLVERLTQQQSPVRLPVEDVLSATPQGYARARQLAGVVRDMLELGAFPSLLLLQVLEERCAVKVFLEHFEPTGTAASVLSAEFGAGILLNAANRRWRRNYDLAHELFHLITWKALAGKELTPDQWAEQEKLADVFASHLLVPAEALDAAITQVTAGGSLTVAGVLDLARTFDVSVDVICWRLKYVYNWPRPKTEALITRCRHEQAGLRESDEQVPRRPARFVALALRAAKRGDISTGRLAQFAGVSRTEALNWIADAGGEDEEVQAPPA